MIRVRLILHSPALEAGVRALLDGDAEISVLGGLASNHGSEKGEAADVQIMTSAAFAHRMASAPVSGSEAALIILDPSSQDMQRLWSSSMPWGALPMECFVGGTSGGSSRYGVRPGCGA